VNGLMVLEVGTRWTAYGKVSKYEFNEYRMKLRGRIEIPNDTTKYRGSLTGLVLLFDSDTRLSKSVLGRNEA
jgi:hypothetical protein